MKLPKSQMILIGGAIVLWIISSLLMKFVWNEEDNTKVALIGMSFGGLGYIFGLVVSKIFSSSSFWKLPSSELM